MFAKLFDTCHGQTLVKIGDTEDGPEVLVYWQPRGLGVCSVGLSFPDDDDGWGRAEQFFEVITEAEAERMITVMANGTGNLLDAMSSAEH